MTTNVWRFTALLIVALWHGAAIADSPPASASASWTVVEPAGETRCSDGTPYRFLVRAGNPSKLHFHLQGGGGCWRRENCDPQMEPTYVRSTRKLAPPSAGVFDASDPRNPLADYTVVFAAYCTGDVHLGAIDRIYPPVLPEQAPLTIHHRGRENVESALQWTYRNVAGPTEIFVSGSSAGAVPSPFYASLLAEHYPSAQIAQLGDGAGGYRVDPPDMRLRDVWGAFAFLPKARGFEHLNTAPPSNESLYVAAARAHPNIRFARYDTAEDAAQKGFLAMRGGPDRSMLPSLLANNDDIRAAAPSFRAFVAGGELHTILARPEFYAVRAGEVRLRDWVALLARRENVRDVRCGECGTLEVD